MRLDRDLSSVLTELAASVDPARRGTVTELQARLAAGRLRVAVVGEAKRGKSTLINALLRQPVLPAGVTPLTALATAVRHGSPPHVIAEYGDGHTERLPLTALWDLVTETGNPDNRRGLSAVTAYLGAPLLAGGVELLDTPGVGSVHTQATTRARAAHEQLDAAIFVLTADPPLSASERDLLIDIAGRAVRLFIALNKVDRLTDAERAEALAFTTDLIRQTLNTAVPVYPISASAALHQPASGDQLAGLDRDLAAYLADRADADLARAVVGHATRLAHGELDETVLTVAAARATAGQTRERVDQFRACLDMVEQRRRDAADIVAATARRALADLNDAAGWDTPAITSDLHATLQQRLPGLSGRPREVEQAGRTVLAEHGADLVQTWTAERRDAIGQRLAALADRLTQVLHRDVDSVRAAAHDVLGVHLSLPVGEEPALPPLSFDAGWHPDVGYTDDIAVALRHRLPGRLGRRLTERALRAEVDNLAPRLLGRARAALQQTLQRATTDLARDIDHRYAAATGGLGTALARAETLAAQTGDQAIDHTARLAEHAATLRRFIGELQSTIPWSAQDGPIGHPKQDLGPEAGPATPARLADGPDQSMKETPR